MKKSQFSVLFLVFIAVNYVSAGRTPRREPGYYFERVREYISQAERGIEGNNVDVARRNFFMSPEFAVNSAHGIHPEIMYDIAERYPPLSHSSEQDRLLRDQNLKSENQFSEFDILSEIDRITDGEMSNIVALEPRRFFDLRNEIDNLLNYILPLQSNLLSAVREISKLSTQLKNQGAEKNLNESHKKKKADNSLLQPTQEKNSKTFPKPLNYSHNLSEDLIKKTKLMSEKPVTIVIKNFTLTDNTSRLSTEELQKKQSHKNINWPKVESRSSNNLYKQRSTFLQIHDVLKDFIKNNSKINVDREKFMNNMIRRMASIKFSSKFSELHGEKFVAKSAEV